MRPAASLPAVLLTASLLALAPAAAHAASTPSPAPADPCAPVDGEVPVMCQAGAPVQDAPAQAPAPQLPRTGPEDVPALAAGALLLLVAGTGLVHAGRRSAHPA